MKYLSFLCCVSFLWVACSDSGENTSSINWENPAIEEVNLLVTTQQDVLYNADDIVSLLCSGLFVGKAVEMNSQPVELLFDSCGVAYYDADALNWDYDEASRCIITSDAWNGAHKETRKLEICYFDGVHMVVKGLLYGMISLPEGYWVVSFDAARGEEFATSHAIDQWDWDSPMPFRQFEHMIASCRPEDVDDTKIEQMLTTCVWWMTWPYALNHKKQSWECTGRLEGAILSYQSVFAIDGYTYYGWYGENEADPELSSLPSLRGPFLWEYRAETNQIRTSGTVLEGDALEGALDELIAEVIYHNDRYVVLRGLLPATYFLDMETHNLNYDEMYMIVDLNRVAIDDFYAHFGRP